jgi:hypothetical protein
MDNKRAELQFSFLALALGALIGIVYIFLDKEKINLAFSSDYGYLFAMVVWITVATSFELRILKQMNANSP